MTWQRAPEAIRKTTMALSTSPISPARDIEQHAAHGRDLHGLFAEQEAGHVEVVDHHVPEQSPGTLKKSQGRREWIPAADYGLLQAADLAVAGSPVQRAVAGVEAPVESDLKRHTGLSENCPAGVRPLHVQVDRFFAEHRLPRPRRAFDQIAVGTRGGGDTNGIEGGITEQGIDGIDGNGPGLSCGGGGGNSIDIVDPHEFHTVVCREDSCAHPADPADSEQSDLEHGIPLGCVTMWRALKLTPGSTAQSSIQVKRGTGMSPPRSHVVPGMWVCLSREK